MMSPCTAQLVLLPGNFDHGPGEFVISGKFIEITVNRPQVANQRPEWPATFPTTGLGGA